MRSKSYIPSFLMAFLASSPGLSGDLKGSDGVGGKSTAAIKMPGSEECKALDWTNIKAPEDATCFGSVEKAFQALPEAVRPFFILMRTTRSAQTSSLEFPRVLIVSPNGTFLMGAASSPTVAKKDLEVAIFDQVKKQWNYAGIDFSQTPPVIDRETCKQCHGQVPHPIWTAYGAWKGSFAANNFLKPEEANYMNRMAAGDEKIPPILKSLSPRKLYRTSERVHPKSKLWGGEENNQVLNYVAMTKAAESTVERMLNDPKIKPVDLVKMSAEISCDTKSGLLEKFGYSVEKDMRFVLEGIDKPGDQFNGLFNASVYLAVELVARAVEKDGGLQSALPDVMTQLNDKRYGYFKTKTLEEFTAWQTTTKSSLRNVMSDYLFGQFFTTLQTPSYCQAVRSL